MDLKEIFLENIIVRFAPSPTGNLHVGGARTAIINGLFARQKGGKFIIRMEDTDRKRSTEEFAESILEDLQWLGMTSDEGIWYQSQRTARYREVLSRLENEGYLYRCYCRPEEIEERKNGRKDWKYDHFCLQKENQEVFEQQNRPWALRFSLGKILDSEIEFSDFIKGKIRVSIKELDDWVLARSDASPTYHLTVVVDDHDAGVTHVIRGEDHLTNTSKQILLYKVLGWKAPVFGHVSLCLGSDRKPLSKRHGHTAVGYYKKQGVLSSALYHYLATLGSGEGEEDFTREELVKHIKIEKLGRGGAVFDIEKLYWLNGQHLRKMKAEEILSLLPESFLSGHEESYQISVVKILLDRMRLIPDFVEKGDYFWKDDFSFEEKAIKKHWGKEPEEVKKRMIYLREALAGLEEFNAEKIEGILRGISEKMNIKAALLIHPLRVAVTGKLVSPGIFELTELLGKERVICRLKQAIDKIGE